jgi:ATP-dependent Clp protease protease subunit
MFKVNLLLKHIRLFTITLILQVIFFNLNAELYSAAKSPGKKNASKKEKQFFENDEDYKKLRKEVEILRLQKEKLLLKRNIQEEEYKKKIENIKNQEIKLTIENKIRKFKTGEMLADYEFQKNKLNIINDKLQAQLRKEELHQARKKIRIDLEMAQLKLENTKITNSIAKNEKILEGLRHTINRIQLKETKEKYVTRDLVYRKYPFKNGKLEISDRRISLNGPIYSRMAIDIVEQIHFFNNKSKEYPIFIIIDYSPGGSVMAGYKIIKAMQASEAPVYVVVKSFAASMAAIITSHAKHSYAYKNAIILHHQMSSFNWGNLTQQEEHLKIAQEWSRRFLKPVAYRMGYSLDDFVKQMYKHNSDGDWQEFGDVAKKLNWVNDVATDIKEFSFKKYKPSRERYRRFLLEEKIDKDGNPYVKLPRLNPFDFYFIYNPDNYYR